VSHSKTSSDRKGLTASNCYTLLYVGRVLCVVFGEFCCGMDLGISRSRSKSISGPKYIPTEFLYEIPKTDLHVHLDGSLRISTLIELAQEQGVSLPSYDEEELRSTVFSGRYETLEKYLEGFKYSCAVMQSAEALERVAYEFAIDNFTEGVRYFEVRFAPQLHSSVDSHNKLDIERVIQSVNLGLLRAKEEFNAALELRATELQSQSGNVSVEPFYEYGIIVSAMRLFSPAMSQYYQALLSIHPYIPYRRVASLASETLVRVAKKCRDEGIPVVALDVAGAEAGYEAAVHKEAYDLAHSFFLNKTVHAGEAYGPESIKQALRDLHAERIGHGYHLFSEELVVDETNALDRAGYISQLTKYICDRRINVEVCLTSNLGTMPHLNIKDHAMAKMLRHGVSVSINTDNRLMSNTTTVNELRLAIDAFNIDLHLLKQIVLNGFKRSFYHGTYYDRREYVRSVGRYFDSIAAKYGLFDNVNSYEDDMM
jgi:adenosine deaminase